MGAALSHRTIGVIYGTQVTPSTLGSPGSPLPAAVTWAVFQWGRSDQPDILIQEGPYIRFCHRAFQDYFAGLCICEASDSIAGRLIEEISDRFETDKVFPLVLSINDEKEKRWILPDVKMISDFVKATHDTDRYARAIVGGIEDISNVMYKIRVLYQFDPPFPLLKAPYDAAQDMKIRIAAW